MTATQAECEKTWFGKPCKQNPVGSWMIAPLAGYKTQEECEKDTGKVCSIDPRDTYKRWLTTEIQKPGTVGVIPKGDPNALPIAQRVPANPVPVVTPPTPTPVVVPVVEPVVTPAPVVSTGLPWGRIILGALILAILIGVGVYFFSGGKKKAVVSEVVTM